MDAELKIYDAIDELEREITASKKGLLSNMFLVDRDYLLDLCTKIRADVPDDIKNCQNMLREEQRIIAEANRSATNIVTEAENRARPKVADAEAQAQQKIDDADRYSDRTHSEADAYAQQTHADADAYAAKSRADTEQEASARIAEAEQHARELVENTEIMRQANQRARETVERADAQARDMFLNTLDEAEKMLKDLDDCFARHSNDLYNYRVKLSQYRGS